ncbi:16S rRNA (guanine(966)-N(2))-methyltransferase RsmD [Helicobacter sp. 13S00477-4]|uniref:16S rRNA (guanine(966)-N(2))-methyltransferase RsmD n=1 Tax=Helicobacter sp. 13S00477-4 TaxID=1905759 RepID=UPI000BA512BF|nr:16S rRNA (guanine(966)-N(2))-methyltransferase RsmD [Helicobacter sp. 13S00477-4]PAF50444.1 16S rRNA (guanine(966)-N(2))-methyltransferase RsmD [Helicobacter sp. 13S00477-4]
MNNKRHFKIIAGKFKGVCLELTSSETTRSSKSILRESLFNVLGNNIIDNCFIEAFAGVGSIGLEALSRGAKKVLFFEKNKESFGILSQNIAHLYSKNPTILANSFFGDTFELLPKAIMDIKEKKILYFDPPFNIRENYTDIYEKCFSLLRFILSSIDLFLVIFEHSSEYKLPENIGHLSIIKQKKFGKSSLSYYASSLKT